MWGERLFLGKDHVSIGGNAARRRAQQHRRGGEIQNFICNLLGREHEIRQACLDHAPGHAVKFGCLRLLRDDKPAALLHSLDAVRAVRPRAGEDDHNGMLVLLLGERGEEHVDGVVERARGIVREAERTVLHRHEFFGRDEIDGVRFHLHAVFRLRHGHAGILGEDIGHKALVVRGKVLDHHKAQPAVVWHMAEKLLQCLQPAGRRAQANDERVHNIRVSSCAFFFGFHVHAGNPSFPCGLLRPAPSGVRLSARGNQIFLHKFLGRHGPIIEIALRKAAAHVLKRVHLLLRLHTLRKRTTCRRRRRFERYPAQASG